MARALFILGHAGSGKTQLAKKWIKERNQKGESWCLMDKDTIGEVLVKKILTSMNLDPHDRDSEGYRLHVRDLEYEACLNVAREQLRTGINVVLPGPWSKEIASGQIFDNLQIGFPEKTQTRHVYLDIPEEELKNRITLRNSGRDAWKLENWDIFKQRLIKPEEIINRKIVTLTHKMSDYTMLSKIKHLYKIGYSENRVEK